MRHQLFAVLIVLWPAILWVSGVAVVIVARLIGCEISAQGPKLCMVWGANIGEQLHPFWALGFYWVYALFWIPIGLIVLAISRRLGRKDIS